MKPHSILVASRDPQLADVRKRVLEGAGYRVVASSTVQEIATACKENKIKLVVIGYSIPPAEKRRICVEAREHCKSPILELYNGGGPCLVPQSYIHAHHTELPEDFLDAVNTILGPSQSA